MDWFFGFKGPIVQGVCAAILGAVLAGILTFYLHPAFLWLAPFVGLALGVTIYFTGKNRSNAQGS